MRVVALRIQLLRYRLLRLGRQLGEAEEEVIREGEGGMSVVLVLQQDQYRDRWRSFLV